MLKNSYSKGVFSPKIALVACVLVAVVCSVCGQDGEPRQTTSPSFSDPADNAWQDLQTVLRTQSPPDEWKTTPPTEAEYKAFMQGQTTIAITKVREYLVKYPRGGHASDARQLEIGLLQSAAMLGSEEREKELGRLLNKMIKDESLPDADRIEARFAMLNLDVKRMGNVDREAAMKLVVDSMIATQKEFPKSERVYSQMLDLVSKESGAVFQQLAEVVAASPEAPAKMKQTARDMMSGKVFTASFGVGKPVNIKFTATDGSTVDLAKLKGKVVLVDFWATWCGPCIAELPKVKAAYNKYHSKGFEIVGISFERDATDEKLKAFIEENNMPWPQYHDGKFWNNQLGKQFNITSIPTMWLLDKKGNLVDTSARDGLAEKVAYLLAQE